MASIAPRGPLIEDLARCVHCGLCSQSCPTYVETGLETESPRGRLHLMRAKAEGRITATSNFLRHIDLCLLCRNCEAVCPSGVPFGRIMQAQRAEVRSTRRAPWWERLVRYLVFTLLMPHPARIAFVAGMLRFYQRSGLQRLVRKLRILRIFPASLLQMEAMLPPLSSHFFSPSAAVTPGHGKGRGRAAVFSGCVMPYLYAEVNEATVRVLARNGYD
ncbi:MAG: 4Fe-4S dicluster domain-containing protein, partial [Chloroflexota bacterium]